MNRKTMLVLALFATAVLACEEPKQNTTGTAGSVAATPAPAPLEDEDLAVPADFDDEAEKDITSANYKAELDTLEKEISAD